MIALDSSSLIAYLSGSKGGDVEAVEFALRQKQVVLPPAVVSELFSDPKLSPSTAEAFKGLPRLPLLEGYWERVGILRSEVIRRGRRAPLADALIAQSCVDHDVPLITRDADFRNFLRAGLKLLPI
ncbi:MAG: PIN domain-containing protein [candidate division NC10 bacterium]